MLKKMKDAALSKGVKIAINTQIKEYGKMLKFNLDSQNKRIDIEVMLEGEHEPLAVHVGKYELTEEGSIHFLKIHNVSTSRAWINTLASTYLEGKKFEIPAEYAKMLKIIV
jgi:hypothetical protein